MTDKAVLFIDAGYLLSEGGRRYHGTTLRSSSTVDVVILIQGILEQVRQHSQLDLLRAYWYDAARDGNLTDEHRKVAEQPWVKLRLGRKGISGEQKGVDLALGLDMVSLAHHRAASLAYLVTGDDDLSEAVEQAQRVGMQVIVMGVPATEGGSASMSNNLARTADSVVLLGQSFLEQAFLVGSASQPLPLVTETPLASQVPIPSPVSCPPSANRPVPTPRSMPARLSTVSPIGMRPARTDDLPALFEGVASTLVKVWMSTASPQEITNIAAGRPQIPSELDRVLLVDGTRAVGAAELTEDDRHQLRALFWEEFIAAMSVGNP